MTPEVRKATASFLRAVPPADEGPAPLSTICRDAGLPHDGAARTGAAILAMLQAFGAVTVSDPDAEDPVVSPTSASAALFLGSLAEFLAADLAVLGRWHDGSIASAPYTDSQAMSGGQFVFLMEKMRAALDPRARPLRTVQLVMVLVKAPNRRWGSRYLVRLDPSRRQYQVPGGLRLPDDSNLRATAVRELEAELPAFRFDHDTDRLDLLGTVTVSELSQQYGAITAHQVTFFQFRSERPRVPTEHSARWASVSTLLSGHPNVQGFPPTTKALRVLNTTLPGGLSSLGPSIKRT